MIRARYYKNVSLTYLLSLRKGSPGALLCRSSTNGTQQAGEGTSAVYISTDRQAYLSMGGMPPTPPKNHPPRRKMYLLQNPTPPPPKKKKHKFVGFFSSFILPIPPRGAGKTYPLPGGPKTRPPSPPSKNFYPPPRTSGPLAKYAGSLRSRTCLQPRDANRIGSSGGKR